VRWPSPQDYREAIQNPSICLSDPELRRADLEIDALGLPVVRSGQYATVFKLSGSDRSWAVRCFLHNFRDRAKRYRLISDFIIRDDLECTVGFELIDKGIKIGSDWFPILKMEYVEGESLGTYVRKNINNPDRLKNLLSSFEEMMLALKSNGIAHGDLQHDNIVVTSSGKLRLIDYDGMYVPALSGWHSNELGHRNYQHPARAETDFAANLDNFSAWVIRGALASLLENPSLRGRLSKSEESLLFTREDFLSPHSSHVFFRLEEIDGAPRLLAHQIRTFLRQPVYAVPFLDESVDVLHSFPKIEAEKLPIWVDGPSELFRQIEDSSRADEAVCLSPAPAAPAPNSKAKPVLSFFRSRCLYVARSADSLNDRARMLSKLEHTLERGEVVLWSGGLRPDLTSSRVQGQSFPLSSIPARTVNSCWAVLFLLFAVPGVYVGIWLAFMYAEVLLPWVGFLTITSFIVIASLALYLQFRKARKFGFITANQVTGASGKGFLHLLSLIFSTFSMFDSPDPNSKGPRHLLYAITDHNLKICIETGSPTGNSKDALPSVNDQAMESTVTLVDVPLHHIRAAHFYSYAYRTFAQRVLLILEENTSTTGSVHLSTLNLWLHGFTEEDRLALRTRLRSLGVQCLEFTPSSPDL